MIRKTAPACIGSVVRDYTLGDLEKTLIEDTTASRANSIPATVVRDRAVRDGQGPGGLVDAAAESEAAVGVRPFRLVVRDDAVRNG